MSNLKVLDLVYSQKLHHIVEQEPVVKYVTRELYKISFKILFQAINYKNYLFP